MYKQHLEFVEFVRSRTSDRIAQWEAKLKCPVITINSTKPISQNIELIVQEYLHLKKVNNSLIESIICNRAIASNKCN